GGGGGCGRGQGGGGGGGGARELDRRGAPITRGGASNKGGVRQATLAIADRARYPTPPIGRSLMRSHRIPVGCAVGAHGLTSLSVGAQRPWRSSASIARSNSWIRTRRSTTRGRTPAMC